MMPFVFLQYVPGKNYYTKVDTGRIDQPADRFAAWRNNAL